MSRVSIMFVLIVLPACAQESHEADPKVQARQAADAYLASISLESSAKLATVEDNGETWLVIYHGRKDWSGGDRLVFVDKKTMQVTNSVAWQ